MSSTYSQYCRAVTAATAVRNRARDVLWYIKSAYGPHKIPECPALTPGISDLGERLRQMDEELAQLSEAARLWAEDYRHATAGAVGVSGPPRTEFLPHPSSRRGEGETSPSQPGRAAGAVAEGCKGDDARSERTRE